MKSYIFEIMDGGKVLGHVAAKQSATGIGVFIPDLEYSVMPDPDLLANIMPYKYKKAFARTDGRFWFGKNCRFPIYFLDRPILYLYGSKGKELARLKADLLRIYKAKIGDSWHDIFAADMITAEWKAKELSKGKGYALFNPDHI